MTRRQGKEIPSSKTSLADLIRQAARESGLSVYQLAIEADVDQSTLNKFVNHERLNLRLDVAERLCRVLEIRFVRRKRTDSKSHDGS